MFLTSQDLNPIGTGALVGIKFNFHIIIHHNAASCKILMQFPFLFFYVYISSAELFTYTNNIDIIHVRQNCIGGVCNGCY
jgi:uncharacterized membrane protein AbrB (regulator of aidB expression)